MSRRLVSEAGLIGILTERMQGLPNGNDSTIGRVFRLRRPDEHGCNWVPDMTSVSSTSDLDHFFTKAREDFNLEDD